MGKFRFFSPRLLSLTFGAMLIFSPFSASADEAPDLRETIQKNLPEGEEIHAFLQLSPDKAWISSTYSHPDSIQTVACTLSFIKINLTDSVPNMTNSLTLLSNQKANKVRAFDTTWTLPTHSEGEMTLKNTVLEQRFNMIAETASTIGSNIASQDLQKLVDSLAQGQEIWMHFSLGEPKSLPTAHIVPLLNDFKQCTSHHHFAFLGSPLDPRANLSDNPF
ncbi:hypothetical protein FAI41_04130 [Acetobacteraceae bacterium]|nr:hypothetical protein FAI41_04130 [Acetobacteraceae bacterium]